MLAFNAAQRAHQNFNESHVITLGAMLITGLRSPVAAAVLGAFWSVNRVAYAIGYTRSAEQGGKGRYWGAAGILAHYVLVGWSAKAAFELAMK